MSVLSSVSFSTCSDACSPFLFFSKFKTITCNSHENVKLPFRFLQSMRKSNTAEECFVIFWGDLVLSILLSLTVSAGSFSEQRKTGN